MNQKRTDRLQGERKQKQRRRLSWVLNGLLLVTVFVIAPLLYQTVDKNQSTPSPAKTDETRQSEQDEAGLDRAIEPAVNLTFVGDVIMAGHVETLLKEKGYEFPYAYAKSLFTQDDYTVANLETPVTKHGTPATNKAFVYSSSPEAIPPLKAAGVDLVNLANNHSMDQGAAGLLDTFSVLDDNEIDYVGAGVDANRAYAPVFVERNGIKIAFFGFSRVVPEVSWYSGKNKPGLAISYDPTLAVEAIRAASEKADLVVVIAHWGKERVDYPVDHQKDLARVYIDAGADLIIGGHPHVLQGFESYNNKWISYSLGNFIFTRSLHTKTWETMVLQAKCTKKGSCELKMLPYHAELGQAIPMNEQDGAILLERVESISTNVHIEPDGNVHEATKQ